jgi:hypothetical protein
MSCIVKKNDGLIALYNNDCGLIHGNSSPSYSKTVPNSTHSENKNKNKR